MPELGRRIGVNKSTIQRYETRTGLTQSDHDYQRAGGSVAHHSRMADRTFRRRKEYDSRTLCSKEMEEHIKKYLDTVSFCRKGDGRTSSF